jgi:hypothetical protein
MLKIWYILNSHNWESVAETELWKFQNNFFQQKKFVEFFLIINKKKFGEIFIFFPPSIHLTNFPFLNKIFLPSFEYEKIDP